MNGHPTREEDFDLYALGALEGNEKEGIESHLASCAECARKLGEARGRVALLALAAPPVTPSDRVKARLLSQVRVTARSDAPPLASSKPEPTGGAVRRWWSVVLVPAGIALAIGSIFLWTENRRLDQQLAALRADMQQQQRQLQETREVTDLMSARDTVVVALSPQPGMPKGIARVRYNPKMGMLMYEGELESAPPDKTYQLWLVPTQGNPISAGVFNPGNERTSHFVVKLPRGVAPKAFAVTLEPAGGRPQPTGPMVLVGPVS